jgi:hypothetical protein
MPIDQTMLGTVVQEQMETIESDHREDDCQLGAVLVVVEVLCPEGEPGDVGEQELRREIRVRTSPMTPHGRLGFAHEALKTIESS